MSQSQELQEQHSDILSLAHQGADELQPLLKDPVWEWGFKHISEDAEFLDTASSQQKAAAEIIVQKWQTARESIIKDGRDGKFMWEYILKGHWTPYNLSLALWHGSPEWRKSRLAQTGRDHLTQGDIRDWVSEDLPRYVADAQSRTENFRVAHAAAHWCCDEWTRLQQQVLDEDSSEE